MNTRQTVLSMCRELTPFGASKKLGISQLSAVCFGAGVGETRAATVATIEKALKGRKVKTSRKASKKVSKKG